ncbi:MAG: DUF1810 domain-containing protein [Synergistaceae bacterium]|nr:DUF1810 domain-containing protein [Synergistaceae bacterium]
MNNNNYNLERFKAAQAVSYAQALSEIKAGRKTSHWIWYIFPQIAGLGTSYRSRQYAIKDINEAKAYLADDHLRLNLEEICSALLELDDDNPEHVMGSSIDAIKLQSSMTLFALASASQDNIYNKVLDKFFNGHKDAKTCDIINFNLN